MWAGTGGNCFLTVSLFERLYVYRQKEGKNDRENYLTELLAGVLRATPQLLEALLGRVGLGQVAGQALEVQTQVSHPEGRPDISIRSADGKVMLLVECKLEAGEGDEQLSRYEAILARCGPVYGVVLFLTKYYEPPRAGQVQYLRWHDLYALSGKVEGGELLEGFREYLALHSLHLHMSFSPIDLLTLENIQANLRKMDEVLNTVEPLFRGAAGGSYQNTQSRLRWLSSGWYGFNAAISGSQVEVGFWSYQGGPVHCFCLAHFDGQMIGSGNFQRELREAWGLPQDSDLSNLERSEPVVKFMAVGQDGADVAEMVKWFEGRLRELGAAVAASTATLLPQA